MRILLFLNDNPYNAKSFHKLCEQYPEAIQGIVLSSFLLPGKKVSFVRALLYFWKTCGTGMFLLRAFEMATYKFKRFAKNLGFFKHHFDLMEFAAKRQIPVTATDNVNDPSFIEKIRAMEPDLIYSKINQIYKQDIIAVPKKGFINFHSSLLPKYKGLDVIFWSMLHGNKEFGVTAHYVVPAIDSGNILFQHQILLDKNLSLYGLESLLYEATSLLVLQVTRAFEAGLPEGSPMPTEGSSYVSYCSAKDVAHFVQAGHRLLFFSEWFHLLFASNHNDYYLDPEVADSITPLQVEE